MLQENQLLFSFLFSLLFTLIGIIVLIISLYLIFKKRQIKLNSEFKYYKLKKEEEILKTQLEIQEHTFQKISREIHDNISLGLTLAKLNTTTFLGQEKKDEKLLEFSIDLISKSLSDLNDISKSLDANQLITHGLIKALESEINVIAKSGIINFKMQVDGDPQYLDSETDLVLLRIFQECCNNTIKHANASTISLNLQYDEDILTMIIIDDGKGFDLDSELAKKEIRKKSGIHNIKYRADILKAQVSIITGINRGTKVVIKTPIKIKENGTSDKSSSCR